MISLSPQSPQSRTYLWQIDVSDMATTVLTGTSSYKESYQQVLPLLESSWRESSSNLKYFDSSLRRSNSCINQYQQYQPHKVGGAEAPLHTWKLSGRISVPFLRKSRINLKRTPSRSMKTLPLESRRRESDSFVNHCARMLSSFWRE